MRGLRQSTQWQEWGGREATRSEERGFSGNGDTTISFDASLQRDSKSMRKLLTAEAARRFSKRMI